MRYRVGRRWFKTLAGAIRFAATPEGRRSALYRAGTGVALMEVPPGRPPWWLMVAGVVDASGRFRSAGLGPLSVMRV